MIFLTAIGFAQKKTISGKITGFNNGDKIILDDPEMMKRIDSTFIANDTFVIKNSLSEIPKSLYLTIKSEGEFYSVNIFIANENIVVNGDKKDFPYHLKISGSKHQDKYTILNDKTNNYYTQKDSISAFLRKPSTDTSEVYKNKIQKYRNRRVEIDKVLDSIKFSFIKSNLNSYAALVELFYLKSKYKKDDLERMYNALQPEYKNSLYGERIATYLKIGDVLKVGDLFYDFKAKDQDGKDRKFSEFIGDYLLLDFTETYCAPCITSAKELKKVNEIYSGKLKIISFYADKSDLIWKKGLERDKPNWLTLWDGKGPSGETIMKYGVKGYPTFFLIDLKGKIIDYQLGYDYNVIENMIKRNVK